MEGRRAYHARMKQMGPDERKKEVCPGKGRSVNRVMVAGMKSHSGKTLITCGLLEILRRRKLDPASYKCGPDFIDPLFHERVTGTWCSNLDTFFSGTSGVRRLVAQCRNPYAVIEGVMGLYDGADAGSTAGASYEIASATATPIILIVDASGIGRTVLSLIRGMLEDDPEHLIRGLILNRCSAGAYQFLKRILETELPEAGYHVRILGAVPPAENIRLESRYLGLKLPGEVADLRDQIRRAADLLEESVDIGGVLELMEEAGQNELTTEVEVPERLFTKRPLTLAVARDEAFCFYYKENLGMFEKRGVKIKWFSPLHDRQIPDAADGLLFGGGYPENHLRELSQNTSMLESVKEAVERGIPSLAECGGFMYLHRTVADTAGNCFELAGVIDGECRYSGHLVRFGYMEIEAENMSGNAGDRFTGSLVGMKGHEFHYYESYHSKGAYVAKKPFRNARWNCIVAGNNGIWGFPHFYYGSDPAFVEAFISRMEEMAGK